MLKVLIAEDDLLIADMEEEVLTEHGYDVCGIGRTVADAVALAWRHKPDLAILDVRLADGDLGTQIALELADLHELGILYVTGNVSAVNQSAARGHACLAKPYRSGDLLRSLEIVAELMDTGTASPPFPPNFYILPAAGQRDVPDTDDQEGKQLALRRQQSVMAAFGSFALRQDTLPAVLKEAVRAGAEGLRTPFCKLHRYRSAQDDLLREAGYGWHSDVAGQAALHADSRSPEGRAFVTRQPVICNELSDRIDFDPHAERRTVSTVDVIIKGGDAQPYGVLGASNNAQQDYHQNDVDFLSGIADILAESIAGFERMGPPKSTAEGLQVVADETHQGSADRPQIHATAPGISRVVLIVEDDVVLQDILAEHFAAEGGFTVLTAATLAEADQAMLDKDRHFDAIVLDVGLPDGNGCEYCARLRRDGHKMPIIMLTGCNSEIDVVRGLDSGANDYVRKPFAWSELFARLRAQLRLFEDSESAVYTIGPYLFRPGKKLLEDKGKRRRILLTSMEAAVLKFLYRWGPGVVARHVLAKEVWGYNSRVATHTLETHMYRLRQKMETDPHFPAILITDKGGYRLNPDLTGAQNALSGSR